MLFPRQFGVNIIQKSLLFSVERKQLTLISRVTYVNIHGILVPVGDGETPSFRGLAY
jgi:hypothetical protein